MSEKEKESLGESEEEAAPVPPIDKIIEEESTPVPPIDEIFEDEAPTSDEGNGNGDEEAVSDEGESEEDL